MVDYSPAQHQMAWLSPQLLTGPIGKSQQWSIFGHLQLNLKYYTVIQYIYLKEFFLFPQKFIKILTNYYIKFTPFVWNT